MNLVGLRRMNGRLWMIPFTATWWLCGPLLRYAMETSIMRKRVKLSLGSRRILFGAQLSRALSSMRIGRRGQSSIRHVMSSHLEAQIVVKVGYLCTRPRCRQHPRFRKPSDLHIFITFVLSSRIQVMIS